MVGGERKTGSAFSWADEVEKEEEEARLRSWERQRSNPFGSARPREIVLQEKGIDWRKLDQDLHQSSNIRSETPAEKPLKENNPAYSARTANKKQVISAISSGRNLQSKHEIRDLGYNRRGVPVGFVIPQKPMGGVFVTHPPRYQTRNVLACLPEEAHHTSDFLYKNLHEAERERTFDEPQKRQLYHHDDQFGPYNSLVGWEREYTEFHVSGRRYSGVQFRRPWMEGLHCGINLGKSVACEERRDADTDYNRRKFLKREALLTPERRSTLYVDHDGRNAGIRLMNLPSSGAPQLGQWQRQHLHNNSGSKMVNSARRETYLEKKEKGQFAGGCLMEEPGDGKRAEVHCSAKNGANFAGNCKKRTMKSRPESYHQLEKRR